MRSARRRQRGQVLAIFAVATIVFVGILAVVVDVSWYWASSLRVQRAADAASLAGVVWLPGDVTRGVAAADAAAAQNGYATGVGVTISANQDSQVTTGGNPNQMDVTISAPVNTFFMRMFGITKIQSTRTSHAVYVLPVPMGSPQNYFGDFGKVRSPRRRRDPSGADAARWTLCADGADIDPVWWLDQPPERVRHRDSCS